MAAFVVDIEADTRDRFVVKGLPRAVGRVIAMRVRSIYEECYGTFPPKLRITVDGVLMPDIEQAIVAIVVHVHRRMQP